MLRLTLLGVGLAASLLFLIAAPSDSADRPRSREAPQQRAEAPAPERIDPVATADAFAGETIRDREAGLRLIQGRAKNAPRAGQLAPDFELKTADGKAIIRLSSFRGQKPVVLIFGSHT
jgi:hypothetical protein